MMKARGMRWAGNVPRIQTKRNAFWWRSLQETNQLENLGVDGKIILK
jgi:hypothetical protein